VITNFYIVYVDQIEEGINELILLANNLV